MTQSKRDINSIAEEKLGIVQYFTNELTKYSGDEWGQIDAFKKGFSAGRNEAIEEVLRLLADMHLRTLEPSGEACVLYDELEAKIKQLGGEGE